MSDKKKNGEKKKTGRSVGKCKIEKVKNPIDIARFLC